MNGNKSLSTQRASAVVSQVIADQGVLTALLNTSNNTLDGVHIVNFASPTGISGLARGDLIYKKGAVNLIYATFAEAAPIYMQFISSNVYKLIAKQQDSWAIHGTAVTYDAGTSANNVLLIGSDGKIPAVDGSNLLNVIASGLSPAMPYSVISGKKNGVGNADFITKVDNSTLAYDFTLPIKICYPDGSIELHTSAATMIGVGGMTGNANYTAIKEKGVAQTNCNAFDGSILRLTESKVAPGSAVNGDYWLDTSVIPNIPYKRILGAWVVTQFVKLGYFTKAGGVIGTITCYPFGDEFNRGTSYNYNNGYSLSYNTVYQAPSNGFISVLLEGAYMNGVSLVYGTTNNPTDVQAQFGDDINGNTKQASFCVPIQKGTYWKVQPRGVHAFEGVLIRFYPMGF